MRKGHFTKCYKGALKWIKQSKYSIAEIEAKSMGTDAESKIL